MASFSPGDRDLGFASPVGERSEMPRNELFQSRRSGFGVCVLRLFHAAIGNCLIVSVPAIGIWGLRPNPYQIARSYFRMFQSRRSGFGVCVSLASSTQSVASTFQSRRSGFGVCVDLVDRLERTGDAVSVPAIGIWGLRRWALRSENDRLAVVSVPAIGIWGLRPPAAKPKTQAQETFQSRRSGFGVCVLDAPQVGKNSDDLFQSRRSGFGVCVPLMERVAESFGFVSVPAIGIWGLRRTKSKAS